MYLFPRDVDPAKHDVLVFEGGQTARVTASYEFGERWAVEVEGIAQIIQLDPNQKVRVQRPQ